MRNAVLIETSWNVKQVETAKTYFVELSINRNIVECKARNGVRIQKKYVVLIETSWNVKNGRSAEENNGKPVLIETSWNVKDSISKYKMEW